MEDDCLADFFEVYEKTKTVGDDSISSDVLLITMPGGQPDEPSNPNLDIVIKQLKAHTPKLQKPKIAEQLF